MPIPEEVDEINEYLKARRKKQELGELPRQDLTPSFIKRMGTALFGEKVKPKVPLQSMQPTYASPMAQSAVRKQLDEIMQERTPKGTTPPLPPSVRATAPPTPRALPPIPRFPESNVWASAAKTTPTLPPKQTPTIRATPIPSTPTPVRASTPLPIPTPKGWGFWNKNATPPAPIAPKTNSPISPAPSPKPVASSSPPSAGFPSYSTIAAAPPKPYREIPPLDGIKNSGVDGKTFSPISSVKKDAGMNSTATPSSPSSPMAPVRGVSAPTAAPAREAYAPPWVTRTIPKPGVTPALSTQSKNKTSAPKSFTQLEIAPPATLAKPTVPPAQSETFSPREEKKSENTSAPSLSRTKPWVTGVLPKEAGEQFAPAQMKPIQSRDEDEEKPLAYSPPLRAETPSSSTPFLSRKGSGEVRVDELDRPARKAIPSNEPLSATAHDAALREEISEEEAIDRLPFEEVEGLSESDLAYLERKEKEHAQTHDEELDQGDPAALRAHLEEQAQKLQANSLNLSNEDPKKEILRRLKKMMEENHSHSKN